MVRKLERDFVSANLSSISALLEGSSPTSLTRAGLESVRRNLQLQLQSLTEMPESRASLALFFSGGPVTANRGIESEFASKALGSYQDIITRLFALRTKGPLGERGVIADREKSKLHITGIVRGSFGFLVEDATTSELATANLLKNVVTDSARLLGTFVEDDEEEFESAIADIDNRVLQAVKTFFDTLAKDSAMLRVVAGESERNFDLRGIKRAAQRAGATTVNDVPDQVSGRLQGLMLDRHEFELLVDDTVIFGKISQGVSPETVAPLYWKRVSADLIRTDVFRGGESVRSKWVMTAVREDG